jgi:hypothetical protein
MSSSMAEMARRAIGADVDHVELLFTTPSSAETEARDSGVVGAIKTIAVVGRAKRVWSDARRTGLLRRAAIGAATSDHCGRTRD